MKLALVGAGPWAQRYATTMGAMHDAELVAVVCRRPQRQRFGMVHWVRSLAELAAGTVDAVVVASSASSHAQVATEVLTQRLPVLMEKLMTWTGQAPVQLHDLAKRQQQLLMVAHTHLYSEAFEALHARVAAATQVVAARSAGGNLGPFRQDYSALWDYGSHDVSMLFRLLGASVRQLNIRQCQPAIGGINSVIRFAAGTSGEIPVEIEIGSGFSTKQRYLELTLVNRDAAGRITERRVIYDDLAA